MVSLSRRLLPVLQLTRMALVFTAIADSQCGLFLRWAGGDWQTQFRVDQFLLIILVSFGLYGFGMSLNDIIDRRRDAQIAAGRPLPSGRIGIITAHVICFLLVGCALTAGAAYARLMQHWLLSFLLVLGTGLLITFYDLAGKYLVAPGLLSLGLIRFFHAVIPSPELPVLWHPLLLLNHVTILSTVAYVWEEKRPALTKLHWWGVLGGLGLFDALLISVVAWRRYDGSIVEALRLRIGLLLPAAAVLLFIAQAYRIRKKTPTRRAAGQKLMLTGLLWLILYDASFVGVYVSPLVGLVLLGLAPVAYFAVQLMRWWSQMLMVSQRPQFRRAVSTEEKKMTR
jgi:4-hydroxybenzoate polyprenyltransferase